MSGRRWAERLDRLGGLQQTSCTIDAAACKTPSRSQQFADRIMQDIRSYFAEPGPSVGALWPKHTLALVWTPSARARPCHAMMRMSGESRCCQADSSIARARLAPGAHSGRDKDPPLSHRKLEIRASERPAGSWKGHVFWRMSMCDGVPAGGAARRRDAPCFAAPTGFTGSYPYSNLNLIISQRSRSTPSPCPVL